MQLLELPDRHAQHWLDALPQLLQNLRSGSIRVDCGDWTLTCSDLRQLITATAGINGTIDDLVGYVPETIVSATSLGLFARLHNSERSANEGMRQPQKSGEGGLLFHHGTLRSGDHLQSEGDILVFGDVNPGARVSATGHVLIWGRLRGIAHAGKQGNRETRIVALQLRPLQLRIADVVARGPDDLPEQGQVEQARLQNGEIIIDAAPAQALTSN